MTGSLAVAELGPVPARGELRVAERFPCDVAASCQPPSDWKRGGQKWVARVRNVSTHGLCLVLGRRFERGAGLAVELVGRNGDSSSTLLARVMHVRLEDGAWVLGCAFVSPLSDEELQALTQTVAAGSAPAESAHAASVADVHFRGTLLGGGVVERRIRKLHSDRPWPLLPGRCIEMSVRDGPTAKLRVDACRSAAGRWVLECTFLGAAPIDLR